jgi:monoamine oxidase
MPHVAVLGAGVAGLTAAYRLRAAGHRVTVFETQDRVGGRAMTIREPFSNGLAAEAGPARFPHSCVRVIRLAKKLGLELEPFYPDSGAPVGYFHGERVAGYEPTGEDFWGYVAPRAPNLAGARRRDRLRPFVSAARRVLRRPETMTFRFAAGTDRLTDALAALSNATIRLNCTVCAVVQRGERVAVTFTARDGTTSSESYDYVVCALPLSIIGDVAFSPTLPPAKTDVAASVGFSSAIRIFLEMRRPFWRESGFNGFAVSDTLGEVWDPYWAEATEPALLVCYAQRDLGARLCAMEAGMRIDYALEHIEHMFPGAREHFVRGASFAWCDQPWVRGGWPLLREGREHDAAAFRQPEGRLYFAGDHASPQWLNTIEGAIESAEFAVEQLCAAARFQTTSRSTRERSSRP